MSAPGATLFFDHSEKPAMAPSGGSVEAMAGAGIHYRPETEQLRDDIVARAAEKGISVNEWLNRVVVHALLKGGKTKITTTVTVEL